jgi:hypothetical protein
LHFDAPEPPRDLAFLDAALLEMRRTDIRVAALNWALWEVLPFFQGSRQPGSASHLPRWIPVMEDRFDLQDDGGFRAHTLGDD